MKCKFGEEKECNSNCKHFKTCARRERKTNAQQIRELVQTDEGLAEFIEQLDPDADNMHYCTESTACDECLERGELIPKEMCRQCLMEYLQMEVEHE